MIHAAIDPAHVQHKQSLPIRTWSKAEFSYLYWRMPESLQRGFRSETPLLAGGFSERRDKGDHLGGFRCGRRHRERLSVLPLYREAESAIWQEVGIREPCETITLGIEWHCETPFVKLDALERGQRSERGIDCAHVHGATARAKL